MKKKIVNCKGINLNKFNWVVWHYRQELATW